MKTAIFASAALALSALLLAGCQGRETPAANTRSNAVEGISITDGKLVLPAVKGNPGAVYFTAHNDTVGPKMIRKVTVKGAKSAAIHQMAEWDGKMDMQEVSQVSVPAQEELAFKPGGLHVMAMDLDDTLKKGGTTDVTLTFVGGDEATFPVEILAAGDAR
jgi:copper(I)-binding protein